MLGSKVRGVRSLYGKHNPPYSQDKGAELPLRKGEARTSRENTNLGGFKEPHLVLIQSSYPGDEYFHPYPLSSFEVIKETQLSTHHKERGRVYNEILASIGLDSPTPSQEVRMEDGHNRIEHELESHWVCTPNRNSATSLIALGQHVLTPRDWRKWTYKSNSLLGGYATSFTQSCYYEVKFYYTQCKGIQRSQEHC